jgi:hypothetical protein
MTAAQADSLTWSGAGDLIVNHASTDAASHVLNGTAVGGDTFNGGYTGTSTTFSGDTVNIGSISNETIAFSGHANEFTITGFDGFSNTPTDTLNFSNLASVLGHTTPAPLSVQDVQIYSGVPSVMTNGEVLAFTDIGAADATAITNLFSGGNNHLNRMLSNASATAEILLVDNGSGATNIWLWQDSVGGDHRVQANELHNLGTLNGVSMTNLQNLFPNYNGPLAETTQITSSHIIG